MVLELGTYVHGVISKQDTAQTTDMANPFHVSTPVVSQLRLLSSNHARVSSQSKTTRQLNKWVYYFFSGR